jgi:VanZ family protein
MRNLRKRRFHLLINILFPLGAVFILIVSLLPTLAIPQADIPYLDKLLHASAYFFLGISAYFFFYLKKPSAGGALLFSVLFCTLWGIGIELLQAYTGRSPEVLDAVMDFCGCLLGSLVSRVVPARVITGG